jgi:NAD(P)-dependent dehydrogenase (short-subunit alcohol dehydrogenase family)
MQGLSNKVFVIAGAGGIGGATAERLAKEGASVVIGNRTAANGEELAHRIVQAGGKAIALRCNVADEADVAQLNAAAVKEYGGIDGLFANAADLDVLTKDSDVLDTSLEIFDATINVNLRGLVLCTRAALPEILKRGGGALVYTSSAVAHIPAPTRYAYSISKSGLHGLVRHVASRWGKDGVRANGIAPGLVVTDGAKRNMGPEVLDQALQMTPSRRLGEPKDIAGLVAFLFSDDGEWFNGQVIHHNGGAVMH